MAQGALPFKYEEQRQSGGMTALAGLPVYLDLAHVMGLSRSVQRHLAVRAGRGWTDPQVVTSLVLLNLAGGDCVDDLDIFEAHFEYPIHTGKIEGVNNKIKVIKRKAYGFHDVRYFTLKIYQAFSN